MTLQELLGIKLPIIQAPMAGVQGVDLAVAVSNAGGLGSLPCAMLAPEAMRAEMISLKQRATGPFSVNFFCHASPTPGGDREIAWRAALSPFYEEYDIDPGGIPYTAGLIPFNSAAAEVVEAVRPPVVSFHFGLPPSELLGRVSATGARILSSATNVDEAQWLSEHGVDVVIAQGHEAGGHRGNFLSESLGDHADTLSLLTAIRREVSLPVVAAGGIASPEAVARAIEMGAAGVQVGTAYLLCPEARTSRLHRAALKDRTSRQTAVTRVFSGRPARAIVNRALKDLGSLSTEPPPFPLGFDAIAPLRRHAEAQGSGDYSALWAGQDTNGCQEIPAGELTRALATCLD